MDFGIKSGNPEKQRCGCLIVGVIETRKLSASARAVDAASGRHLSNVLRRGDLEGKAGQALLLHGVPGTLADRVLLVGCGRERDINERHYRTITENAMRAVSATGAGDAVSYLPELNVKGRDYYWKLRQALEVASHVGYEFREFKSGKKGAGRLLKRLTLMVPSRRELPVGEQAVRDGLAISHAVKATRDLANRPANVCTPTHLANHAQSLARSHRNVRCKVMDRAAIEKLGMRSFLSVAQGSQEPPKLIVIEYHGGRKGTKPVVLVGKGVTFDTGGISIKPAQAMDEMKFDMCGAAAVMGAIAAAADLRLPLDVVGVIPATENMPGGRATKPGDIFTSMSGQTIEVLNTDAEGRLILCDALTYAERFNPAAVIDIATLTGACVVALGHHATGLLANHQPLARALLDAGENSADRAWQLPLWEEYQKQLDSPFADFANVGGRDAGTITAACFLSRFTEKYHWAHLDIAGTAWISGKHKGATGRPVPLLVQYLIDQCAAR
jgi:leucyl aminopeptidase